MKNCQSEGGCGNTILLHFLFWFSRRLDFCSIPLDFSAFRLDFFLFPLDFCTNRLDFRLFPLDLVLNCLYFSLIKWIFHESDLILITYTDKSLFNGLFIAYMAYACRSWTRPFRFLHNPASTARSSGHKHQLCRRKNTSFRAPVLCSSLLGKLFQLYTQSSFRA